MSYSIMRIITNHIVLRRRLTRSFIEIYKVDQLAIMAVNLIVTCVYVR